MSKALTKALRKQHALYRTEANAKRRNLAEEMETCETDNLIYNAERLNGKAVAIIRTEAKAVAIEELAAELGIELAP